jgi:hypothetical protein
MHVHLVCQLSSTRGMPGMASGGAMGTLSSAASQLLQAICIRSSEGRKRVVNELVAVLNVGKVGTSSPPQPAAAATGPARTPASSSKSKRGAGSSSSGGGASAAGPGEGRSSSPPAVPVADALQTELALQPGPAPSDGPAAARLACYLQKPGCPPPAKVSQRHRWLNVLG